jgi:aerobic carbon-monoxide dehydrogenase medium subunit
LIPAIKVTVPWRLYSCSRAKVARTPGPLLTLYPPDRDGHCGGRRDATALDGLDQAARRACKPIDDKRGTIEYRIKVSGAMARLAATIAYERAREGR